MKPGGSALAHASADAINFFPIPLARQLAVTTKPPSSAKRSVSMYCEANTWTHPRTDPSRSTATYTRFSELARIDRRRVTVWACDEGPMVCLWMGIPKPDVSGWMLNVCGVGGLVGLAFWTVFFNRGLLWRLVRRAFTGGRGTARG